MCLFGARQRVAQHSVHVGIVFGGIDGHANPATGSIERIADLMIRHSQKVALELPYVARGARRACDVMSCHEYYDAVS